MTPARALRALTATTAMVVVSLALSAQTPAAADAAALPPDETPAKDHLAVMAFQPLPIDGQSDAANAATAAMLGQNTVNLLNQSSLEVVGAPTWPQLRQRYGDAASEFAIILEHARGKGAQSALFIQFFRDGKRLTLIGKAYDIWGSRLLASATRSGQDDIGLLTIANDLVAELLDKVKAEGERLVRDWGGEGASGMSRSIVFTSRDEYATVSLHGGEELGIVFRGYLKLPYLPLAVKRDIVVDIAKPGYYPKTFTFQVNEMHPTVKLPPLFPKSKWSLMAAVDPQWIFGDGEGGALQDFSLGLGLRWSPVDEYWYLQFWYLLKVPHLAGAVSGAPQPVWLMHDFSLAIAASPFNPDSFFRVFFGVGLGAYVTAGSDGSGVSYFDPYLELPSIGIQFNLHPVTVDFELGSQFVLDLGGNLMPQGLVRSFGLLRGGVGFKW